MTTNDSGGGGGGGGDDDDDPCLAQHSRIPITNPHLKAGTPDPAFKKHRQRTCLID